MPIAAKKFKKPLIQPSIKKWDNIDRAEHLVAVHWNKNMKDLKNQLNTKKDCCCIIVASLIICHERKKMMMVSLPQEPVTEHLAAELDKGGQCLIK